MNWTSIVLAAISGGLAGLIAMLVAGSPKERGGAYAGVFVVAFLVLNFISRQYILPRIEANSAESQLLEIPAFVAIKKYDSKTFYSLLGELKQGLKDGKSEIELIAIIRGQMTAIVASRLPTASDEAVVAYIKVMITELHELNQAGGDLCYRYLFPTAATPFDPRQNLSKETQQADLAALADVIRTSATDPQPKPPEDLVAPKLQPIVAELNGQYGSDLQMLQNPAAPGVDKTKICAISTSLYEKILRLPASDSGKVLRYMMSKT